MSKTMTTKTAPSQSRSVKPPAKKPAAKKKERGWLEALNISNKKGGSVAERVARLTPTQRDAMRAEFSEDVDAKLANVEPLSPEAKKNQLYAAMVKAVREWIAAEHPYGEDRLDITLFNSLGCGDTVAQFHAHADDEYTRGDMRALNVTTEEATEEK